MLLLLNGNCRHFYGYSLKNGTFSHTSASATLKNRKAVNTNDYL